LVSSDEHKEDGESTEVSEEIIEMSDKRLRKSETLKSDLPEPEYYGSKNPETVFVGYGSVGNTVRDILDEFDHVGYLHYQYIYPLKFEKILDMYEDGAKIVLVENNQTGEFGKLIKQESGFEIKDRLLKYDGRPFFIEDILDFLGE
jgi:2-oxoglutarate ferredoxin oxidoreductase subunit alpha